MKKLHTVVLSYPIEISMNSSNVQTKVQKSKLIAFCNKRQDLLVLVQKNHWAPHETCYKLFVENFFQLKNTFKKKINRHLKHKLTLPELIKPFMILKTSSSIL